MSEEVVMTMARLDNLEIRLYSLTTKSHLRIGAGEGTSDISAAENPIIRALVFHNGQAVRQPYLPGSSLHGVLRAWVEKALRSSRQPVAAATVLAALAKFPAYKQQVESEVRELLGKADEEPVTDAELTAYWPVYKDVSNPLSLADQSERITQRDRAAGGWKAQKAQFWQEIGRKNPCEVSDIFGFAGQRGRVKITHAFPGATQATALPVDVITRVAINRLTGAADEGKLFDLEAIPPGVTFYFFVMLENMQDVQKQHFDKGVRALNLQLANIGAHGTIGFGQVHVEQVYAATISPKIFDLSLEEIVPTIKKPAYQLRVPLDEEKYPPFFLALSSLKVDNSKQPPTDAFKPHVVYR